MASRDYIRHTVSSSSLTNSRVGDEQFDPSTNTLYKRLAVNGTAVTDAPVLVAVGGNVALNSTTGVFTLSNPNTSGAIALSVAGYERARVDQYGNLSIGTTSVLTPVGGKTTLSVNGATGSYVTLGTAGGGMGSVFADSNFGISGSVGAFYIINSAASQPIIFQSGPSYTERMRVSAGGNILVGTSTTPLNGNATVVVQGLGTNGGGIQLVGGTAGGFKQDGLNGGGWALHSYTGTVGAETYTERMRIDSFGNVSIGTSSVLYPANGTNLSLNGASQSILGLGTGGTARGHLRADATNVVLQSDAGWLWLYNTTNSPTVFGTNSVERMRITGTGNVGIGTATVGVPYVLQTQGPAVFTSSIDVTIPPSVAVNSFNSNVYSVAGSFVQWNDPTGTNYQRSFIGQVTPFNMFIENASQANQKGNILIQPYGGNLGVNVTSVSTGYTIQANGVIADAIGNVRDLVNNGQGGAYVLVASDNGKMINITTGGVTVNTGIFSAGNNITIFNNSAASQTITQGASVTMYLAGTATTGNRTLSQRGICTIVCVAANTFVISGSGLS